jgi:hypothetical protein
MSDLDEALGVGNDWSNRSSSVDPNESFIANGPQWSAAIPFNPEDLEPKLLPEGRYTAMVKSIARETNKNSGNEQFHMIYTVTSGEHKGQTIHDWLYVTANALKITASKLHALGCPTENGAFVLKPENVVGRPCSLEIKHDEYNGRKSAKVRYIVAADDMAIQAMHRMNDPLEV